MANLWQHWTPRDLIDLLEQQAPNVLSSLRDVLPPVMKEGTNPDSLYLAFNLVKLVSAFLPSDAFAKSGFRRNCLNRLAPPELAECARAVGVGVSAVDFDSRREKISSATWTSDFARRFVGHFGLPDHFLPAKPNKTPSSLTLEPPSHNHPSTVTAPFKQLKDYQFGVYFDSVRQLDSPRARFVIQMPTGSGKTRTSMEIVAAVLNRPETATVVWLAHSSELCEQAMQCFLDVWPHLASRRITAFRSWEKHPLPSLAPGEGAFVVAGIQKLHAAVRRDDGHIDDLRNRCTLVVVDEAHKAEAPTYKETILKLLGESTQIVGLTATPGRTDADETVQLADFFFNQLVSIPTPAGSDVIEMLRHREVLSQAHYVPIITGIDVNLTAAQRKRLEERFDLPEHVLKKLGSDNARNLEIIKRLVGECNKGRRILVFACSIAHSKFLTSVMLFLGIKAGHVDGGTPTARRKSLIDSFRSGRLQVLCNYGVLTTGFDAPKCDVVFIARPTLSPVLYSQMIGRGLRGPAIGGTASCTLIDVRDNIVGFGDAGRVYRLFERYWVN